MLNTYKKSAFGWSLMLVLFFGSRIQVSLSAVTVSVEEWVDIQESTVMTCSETGIFQLEWFRSALDAGSSTGATLIYDFSGGTATPGSGIDASRYEFVGSGNFPLTIKSVELGDEGRYWCNIVGGSGQDEDDGPLNIRVPVVKTNMSISYNGDTYTNEENIDVPAGTQDATFNCTAPGIKPGATVFVWTLDNTTVPSTGPPTQSPNGASNMLTDSTSTVILNITDDFSKPLWLCCATTNRQDGSSETEASICVTLNLIDPCQENPCKNGGTCANENGMPSCNCAGEFTGDTCSEKATDQPLSVAAIAGISCGCVLAGLCLIGIGIYLCYTYDCCIWCGEHCPWCREHCSCCRKPPKDGGNRDENIGMNNTGDERH